MHHLLSNESSPTAQLPPQNPLYMQEIIAAAMDTTTKAMTHGALLTLQQLIHKWI